MLAFKEGGLSRPLERPGFLEGELITSVLTEDLAGPERPDLEESDQEKPDQGDPSEEGSGRAGQGRAGAVGQR
ncbi:hypothetical protein ACFQZ8_30855 [Micromonospora azadirachtae]|uniref:Uncharacterized protein n=1 Tax=Micromonospora azadirachtae TaxID=1970735 RepID=A0ABW3ABN1_9ACTN